MSGSILPDPPADSELARWVKDGDQLEPSHSNIIAIDAPDEPYGLRVQLDDPVNGYLIDLFYDDTRLARTVVDDRETAGQIAAELAAAAPELRELDGRPGLGPERIDRIEVKSERESPPTPDEWDEQEEEWENALQEAYDDAEIPRSKGSLVIKTIDGRDYYYLQWREGDTVTSQYVAPASPAR
jgi:hypothetical protein